MSRVYTITLQLTTDKDFDLADYLSDKCRAHGNGYGCCPVGEMNCPFFETKVCSAVWDEDWKPLLQDFHDVKTS
jgi:hypothetical protein